MPTTPFNSYAAVILDGMGPRPFDYGVPAEMTLTKGSRVRVPLRGHLRDGTILALKAKSQIPKVLPIAELLEGELPPDLLDLASWISRYTLCPLPRILKVMLPGSVRRETKAKEQLVVAPKKTREELRATCASLQEKAPAQARVLEALLKNRGKPLVTELLELAKATRPAVQALATKGLITLHKVEIDRSPLANQEYFRAGPKILNEEQKQALDAMTKTLDKRSFGVHLLHGVTGSGKTEVYLQAIDHTLKQGRTAILLVPEIALTGQTVERCRARFEGKIALLHHRLSEGERADEWKRMRKGEAQIAIGPRSAIFSPLANLGLIIVDEEHEPSYKQSDAAPHYNARDTAVVRGKLTNSCVILGSATPSLESYHNALHGKYQLNPLLERADSANMPTVRTVELGKELLSDELLGAIKKRFEAGEQSLLFLNRRGTYSMQFCSACREAVACPHCDLSLTFHKNHSALHCHLCGYTLAPPPRSCPTCGASDPLSFRGAGTEQVERALHAIFPELRTLRIDADTTRHKGSLERSLRQMRQGKADVLIGTQMIAKGLHLPQVTLVGVLNSDLTLNIPDPRSSERLFQLLTQVAGRAGRAALPGEVLIQTRMPENSTIQHAARQDYLAFYEEEIAVREAFHYPPFTHLIKVTATGEGEKATQEALTTLHEALRLPSGAEKLPVTPCGYARIKDNYRFQFLLRGPSVYQLNQALAPLQGRMAKNIRLDIDVDPIGTYF